MIEILVVGGVALLVKANISHDPLPLGCLSHVEAIGVTVNTSSSKIADIQIYVTPRNEIKKLELDNIFHSRGKVILMGDFNAKHRAWNCYNNNLKGKTILNYCFENSLILNAPEVPAHFSKIGRPSVLDFFITKNVPKVKKAHTLPILTLITIQYL